MTFRNEGSAAQTVTFTGVAFDATPPGGEATRTFDAPGTYEYTCRRLPPDMKGTLLVRPSA